MKLTTKKLPTAGTWWHRSAKRARKGKALESEMTTVYQDDAILLRLPTKDCSWTENLWLTQPRLSYEIPIWPTWPESSAKLMFHQLLRLDALTVTRSIYVCNQFLAIRKKIVEVKILHRSSWWHQIKLTVIWRNSGNFLDGPLLSVGVEFGASDGPIG